MFDSVGWGEVLVLVVASLFILGPERLPAAAGWLARTVRQAKELAAGATAQIRDELGPEFDDLRRPLAELRTLRGRDPRRAALDALLHQPESRLGQDENRNAQS